MNKDKLLVVRLKAEVRFYEQGFKDGFVDAHITDSDGFPDETLVLKRLDVVALVEGYEASADYFASLARPTASAVCAGCEGSPAPENDPCAVCGKSAASADVVERVAKILNSHFGVGDESHWTVYTEAAREVSAALSASPVQELVEALEPFAEFADPRKVMPPDLRITQGSEMAKRQLTMGDCYRAAATLAKVRDQ